VTYYYAENDWGVVSFEEDPMQNITADAKGWDAASDKWGPIPGSTGIGGQVLGGNYRPISEAEVPAQMERCRAAQAAHDARQSGR
jgi:hypothetical protein